MIGGSPFIGGQVGPLKREEKPAKRRMGQTWGE